MAKKTTIAQMYEDMVTAFTGVIDRSAIYCGGRPDFIDKESKLKRFVVLDLPVSIEDYAVGKKKFHLTTTGVAYLFDKSKKDKTLNVSSTSDFVDSVESLFPIVGTGFSCVNPTVLMHGADEYQYQVTTITFDVHSR